MDDANTWASLPVDLLVEILRRLDAPPTRTVVAFAGTCKPWRRAHHRNVSSLKLHPDRFNPTFLLGFFHRQWLADATSRGFSSPGPVRQNAQPGRAADTMPPWPSNAQALRRALSSRDGFRARRRERRRGLFLCNPLPEPAGFIPSPVIGASRPCRFVLVTDPRRAPDGHLRRWLGPGQTIDGGDDHRFRFFLCDGDKDVVVCPELRRLLARHRAWMERVELPETIMEMGSRRRQTAGVTGLTAAWSPLQVWELGGGGEWTLRRRIDVPEEVMTTMAFVRGDGCLFGDVEGEDILIDVERGVITPSRVPHHDLGDKLENHPFNNPGMREQRPEQRYSSPPREMASRSFPTEFGQRPPGPVDQVLELRPSPGAGFGFAPFNVVGE
ncbi:hypothetical protein HU200_014335 [Digitaria exilis]|uniref:F-box domain-containing protein n=1 Tax=Digitaria exilis TaxID=1010633 RepID=A0A835FBA0_9POAL|nr:hypothetical protein HU200_014335 [Digitaria exilis]